MIIYLDVDGVLADFVGGVCRVFNLTREELYSKWAPGVWDLGGAVGVTESDFWEGIDRAEGFWQGLDATPDAYPILRACQSSGPPVLMTSPPLNPSAAAGKVEWIRTHFPELRRRFAVTPCKELFAHPGAVLVDDSDDNVRKFEAAGGRAVLVPRRWNSQHHHACVSADAMLLKGLHRA